MGKGGIFLATVWRPPMTVVSGGARGCDFYAHSGALKANGKTVLVMGLRLRQTIS
ncbi:MAG: DNA-processing protein DprA [Oscillospiraceae bacterium]